MSNYKMTAEEAIKELNTIKSFLAPEFKEAINKASEALKKEVSERPEYEGDGSDDKGNIIYDIWICPNCGCRYEVDYEEYDHCPNCGQAVNFDEIKGA